MKTTKSIMSAVLITVMSAVVIIFSACEKDKDSDSSSLNENALFDSDLNNEFDSEAGKDQQLTVTPESGVVRNIGDVLSFRVGGGRRPYTWVVSTPAAGTLNDPTTYHEYENVQYTAVKVAYNTITVTDYDGRGAVIPITASVPNLTVSPSALNYLATDMGAVKSYQFSTTGGTTPISWSVDSPSLCSITPAGGLWSSIVVPANNWSNTTIKVIATDSVGATATAQITFK